MNNMRQMAIAAKMYADTYDDYYPISYYYNDDYSIYNCWDFTYHYDGSGNIVKVVPGLLWMGKTIEKIQQCPSFKGNSNTPNDPYTGYNYNISYIGHGQGLNIETPAKTTQVKKPAKCALFGDGQWSEGANKFMRAPLRAPGDRTYNERYAGTQGFRHNNRTNVVWADGHASSQAQLYKITEPAANTDYIAQGTGFLSEDNSAYSIE